jgi:hypothetical protein
MFLIIPYALRINLIPQIWYSRKQTDMHALNVSFSRYVLVRIEVVKHIFKPHCVLSLYMMTYTVRVSVHVPVH